MSEILSGAAAGNALSSISSIAQRALAGTPTREQADVAIAAIVGYVVLQAIKSGYNFEYDHSKKKFSADAGKPSRSWAWDEPNPHAR